MMKTVLFIALISLSACGRGSSPEGRMTVKVEDLHDQIDSLKNQNAAILDSIESINSRLDRLQQR